MTMQLQNHFFASMKIGELSHHYYNELDNLLRDVDEYIEFFNTRRLHGKLGYKTPNQIGNMFKNGELEAKCSNPEKKKTSEPPVMMSS